MSWVTRASVEDTKHIPFLVGYLPGLYPDTATFKGLLKECASAGLKFLEIGIPAADPYLDGDVIRKALVSVHQKSHGFEKIIRKSVALAHQEGICAIVMLYWESVTEYGLEAFVELLKDVKADGVLVPNAGMENIQRLHALLAGSATKTVNFVRFEADDAEIDSIIAATSGMLYVQSMPGATGGSIVVDDILLRRIERIKTKAIEANLAIGLGFGISTGADAREAHRTQTDAIIVGTGFVKAAGEGVDYFAQYLEQFSPFLTEEVSCSTSYQ